MLELNKKNQSMFSIIKIFNISELEFAIRVDTLYKAKLKTANDVSAYKKQLLGTGDTEDL